MLNKIPDSGEDIIDLRKEQKDQRVIDLPEDILWLSNAKWTEFFEETNDKILSEALNDVWESVSKLFAVQGMDIKDFFTGRYFEKEYYLFTDFHNNYYLDEVAKMIYNYDENNEIARQNQKYIYKEKGIFQKGWFKTIGLLTERDYVYDYPLVDIYLATYICKYMENYLRKISKYKSKTYYKYGGMYCIDAFTNNDSVPETISNDYKILNEMLRDGSLRKAIEKGMENYFSKNEIEYEKWNNYFGQSNAGN